MGRLNNISGKDAVRAFQKAGWQKIGQVGSHVDNGEGGYEGKPSIAQHKELSVGTLRALIRHAGLSVEEFLELI